MLAMSRVPFTLVAPMLALLGVLLAVRGVAGALLVIRGNSRSV